MQRYMAEVARHPVLGRAEELALATAYREHNDVEAAHTLVTSNLRFVVKVAHEYARFGLRLLDLVQEGNVGLMVAVKRFDPARGYRLITYAVWWIRAQIQGFIMRSWSLVRLGATSAHRQLFFRLRALKARAARAGRQGEAAEADIAACLGVSQAQVAEMGVRLAARDFSLDAGPAGEEGGAAAVERLEDPGDSPEATVARARWAASAQQAIRAALGTLSAREQAVVQARLVDDEPATLAALGGRLGISRERVRQIEQRARAKLRAALQPTAPMPA